MNHYSWYLTGGVLGLILIGFATIGLATYTAGDRERAASEQPRIAEGVGGMEQVASTSGAATVERRIVEAPKPSSSQEPVSTSLLRTLGIESETAPARPVVTTFPVADSTWKSRFGNPSAPASGYRAYYFDTTKSSFADVSPKTVDSVDIKFAWYFSPTTGEESRGGAGSIQSESFGAYWIGTFTAPSDGKLDLTISQSWASSRVIIDGRVVYDGENTNETIPLTLSAGSHVIEVEYENNWHTVEFSVGLRAPSAGTEGLSEILSAPGAKTWHANVYESGNMDNTIDLSLPSGNYGTVVLYLSSYSAVHWDFSGVPARAIDAVVISSYAPGADARNVPEGTKVFYGSDGGYGYSGNYEDSSTEGMLRAYSPKGFLLPGGKTGSIVH